MTTNPRSGRHQSAGRCAFAEVTQTRGSTSPPKADCVAAGPQARFIVFEGIAYPGKWGRLTAGRGSSPRQGGQPMGPAPCARTVPVPPPAYHRAQAKVGPALHVDALTLVSSLHLLALCRLAVPLSPRRCPPPLPAGPRGHAPPYPREARELPRRRRPPRR